MEIKVKKASGIIEDIDTNKLRASLIRSGADREMTDEIIDKVLFEVEPITSTKKIYRLAKKYLRQLDHSSQLRYSIKKALFRLGPSGYPFEKYFSELLKYSGYKTKTNTVIDGRCVSHEVDILAVKDNEIITVECKYHNRSGIATDIKVAMYVYARFRDLGHGFKYTYPDKIFKGWLVTNTRFTSEAVKYAECMGLNIKSWGYPEHDSLEKMIESKKLYPVTVISGIRPGLIRTLVENRVILLKDLAEMDIRDIRKILPLSEKKSAALRNQAVELCLD